MKPYVIDPITDGVMKENLPSLEPGVPAPEDGTARFMYLPKLRCNDCPGKVYNAEPGKTEAAFEVHLRNRLHRERVERRQG